MKAPCVRLIPNLFPEPLCVFRRKLLSRESCMKQHRHSPGSHSSLLPAGDRPTPLGSHSSPGGWVSISPFPHILLAFLWSVHTPTQLGLWARRTAAMRLLPSPPHPLSAPPHILLQLWISCLQGARPTGEADLLRGWCPPPVRDRGNSLTGPSASSPRLRESTPGQV